ncbi:hypothetical protein FQV39_22760 [Bosea sp. F3-2]|uniref:hypothetical protein n=1 Tax=Bosea sp. F3-2 TaxID=2599640 RepID=UPI0011EF6F00|nr:hypothetical protein [Bosea sp. F3-2]QEL25102.1 hypothetical protein FQV39_22760 [Bosea sp. F3-2]
MTMTAIGKFLPGWVGNAANASRFRRNLRLTTTGRSNRVWRVSVDGTFEHSDLEKPTETRSQEMMV